MYSIIAGSEYPNIAEAQEKQILKPIMKMIAVFIGKLINAF